MRVTTVHDCTILEVLKVNNRAGSISIVERFKSLPFEPKRVFYLYDIPSGESRGAHAHRMCHQFIIAASGSFEVFLDDGVNKKTVTLNRPFYGLHVPPGIWAYELNFSSGSICLVLASQKFIADEYLREYKEFLKWKSLK